MHKFAVPLSDRLRHLPQYLLPQRLLTGITYRIARISTPWIKNLLIRRFIVYFKVDMSEAAESDWRHYRDFNHFFTRALRKDIRPLAQGQRVLCCPVDGTVSQVGSIADDLLLQAKGCLFSLTQLLGGDEQRACAFRDGNFVTFYLSPRDYHRIHMPTAGQLREMIHIPGKLFSVSPLTTRVVPEVFARNERVVTLFATAAGSMALILIGAINVASIETVWAGVITPPLGTGMRAWDYPETGSAAVTLDKGTELGRFNMGSTVILLFTQGAIRWDSQLRAGVHVRMGQKVGEILRLKKSPGISSSRPIDRKCDHLGERGFIRGDHQQPVKTQSDPSTIG
jgi:phosphatidylserine decarboxylase